MKCAWEAYLNLLPQWMRTSVDRLGRDDLQELRLRIGLPPELNCTNRVLRLGQAATKDDLHYCINAASRYSPWSATTTADGYITAQGGHRIGICGEATVKDGKMTGFARISSLCIRVARDFPGIANRAETLNGSILIIGTPGAGKTTLLRDLIRNHAKAGQGSVAVVDERGEIFPFVNEQNVFSTGSGLDILTGCDKKSGIESVLRNMGPTYIAVDEITAQQDCEALIHAGWCGVKLLATAHAATKMDLVHRPVYQPLLDKGLFDYLVILQQNKTWTLERMEICSTNGSARF